MQALSRRTWLAWLATSAGVVSAQTAPARPGIRLRLEVGAHVLTATLTDQPIARDLLSLLPLALSAKDFGATEKVAYLPRKLTTQGAPTTHTPVAGDLCYYAPWGNLALFYADGKPSPGLVPLGRFDGSTEELRGPADVPLRITQIR